MKYSLVVVLILSLVVPMSAQNQVQAVSGGTGRTVALGGGPYNPYITDYTDVFVNPAYASRYQSLLYSDIGYGIGGYAAAGQYVGYTMSVGGLSVGLAVGRREGPMFPENSYGAGNVTYGNSDYMVPVLDVYLPGAFGTPGSPLAPLQVFVATRISGMTLGAAIYRSSWSRNEEYTAAAGGASEKMSANNTQTGFKVGTLMDIGGSTLDVSVLLRMNGSTAEWSDTNTAVNPNTSKYDVSGTEFGVNARLMMKMSDQVELVPVLRYMTFGYKPEYTDNTTPAPTPANNTPNDYGRTDLEIGVGVNNRFENGFVTVGLSFQQITLHNDVTSVVGTALETRKQTRTATDLPKLNFGAELGLTDWLTGRFGYFKRFTSTESKVEAPNTPTTVSEVSSEATYVPTLGFSAADQQVSLGLGIKVSRLSLDGYVGEQFLSSGTYLLSGMTHELFGVLSVSFRF